MEQQQSPQPAAPAPQAEGSRGLVKWAEKVQGQALPGVTRVTRDTTRTVGKFTRRVSTRIGRAAMSAGKAARLSWKGLETAQGATEAVQNAGEAAPRKVSDGASAAKEQLENRKAEAQATAQRAREAGQNITEALGTAKERLGGQVQQKPQAQKPEREASPPAPSAQKSEPPGYLGMTTLPIQLPQDVAEAQHSPRGLILLNVEKDGPADEAGLQLGDTLIKLDGRSLNEVGDLVARLSHEHLGQPLQATILRSGSTRDVTLTVQPRP